MYKFIGDTSPKKSNFFLIIFLKQTAAFLHRTQPSYGLASEERKRRTKEGRKERKKEGSGPGSRKWWGGREGGEGGGGRGEGCRRLVLWSAKRRLSPSHKGGLDGPVWRASQLLAPSYTKCNSGGEERKKKGGKKSQRHWLRGTVQIWFPYSY